MGRNVRRHSHHQAPRGRWPLPFSKGAPSDRGAVLAVPPGAARALGGSPGGGRGRVRPRCALEGVPAGRARNKGWMMSTPSKEASVGKWSRSCSQPLRRPSCATCEMSDEDRAPPSSCGHQLLQSYGHRPAARLLAAAAQRRFAALCRNTGGLQPSQQRARKQASFAVSSVQQPASTCPYRAATSKRRPPAKQLRGFMQQRRWSWVASG